MKKLLFVLPLSFCLGSETIHDATYKTDKYSELVSEFKEKVESFHSQMKEELQQRFEEAWEKKYPDILLSDFYAYFALWDIFLPNIGISKTSGEQIDRNVLSVMVINVWNSVISHSESIIMEVLPKIKYRLNDCIDKNTASDN